MPWMWDSKSLFAVSLTTEGRFHVLKKKRRQISALARREKDIIRWQAEVKKYKDKWKELDKADREYLATAKSKLAKARTDVANLKRALRIQED